MIWARAVAAQQTDAEKRADGCQRHESASAVLAQMRYRGGLTGAGVMASQRASPVCL